MAETHHDRFAAAVPAEIVAARYAAATGSEEVLSGYYGNPGQVVTQYGTAGRDADYAVVVVEDISAPGVAASGAIGRYDPSQSKWRFYPELVGPPEAQLLHSLYVHALGPPAHAAAAAYARVHGTPFIDVLSVQTRKVRRDSGTLLSGLDWSGFVQRPGVAEQALDFGHAPGPMLAMDEGSTVHACLIPSGRLYDVYEDVSPRERVHRGTQALIHRASAFMLILDGVIVENPERPGHALRTARQVHVATRSGPDFPEWQPNHDLVSEKEWGVLEKVARVIDAADRRYPEFSPQFCAIALNAPDLAT